MNPGLRDDLASGFLVDAREVVGSTNDEARALAEAGARDLTVVWARRQEAGRGRRGRGWSSPEGNLYSSIVVQIDAPAIQVANLAFVAALAVADTVDALLGEKGPARLKWPNDVLVDGRKIAGILLESAASANERVPWVVIGAGVNLASHPTDSERPAISAVALTGRPPDVERTLSIYLSALGAWLARWRAEGFAPIRAAWLARAHGVGYEVVARLHDREERGRFVDLGSDGALILERGPGDLIRVTAGEVFFPWSGSGG